MLAGDALAVQAAAELRAAAAATDVDPPEALPAPLDVMSLGNFEPDVWIPSAHPAARRGTISLGELAGMDVIHGPRRLEPGIYDAWTEVLRTAYPRFAFTDPPVRHSLPIALSFAATADRPTAVLTGPGVITGTRPRLIRLPRAMIGQDMSPGRSRPSFADRDSGRGVERRPARPLQQILFDAADGITSPTPVGTGEHEPAAVSQ